MTLPLKKRIMKDGAGRLRKEFLELMEGIREDSLERYQDIVTDLRAVTRTLFQSYKYDRKSLKLRPEELGDILIEMDALAERLRDDPKDDSDIYDQHVVMLRLISLVEFGLIADAVERQLHKQVLKGSLNKNDFIY